MAVLIIVVIVVILFLLTTCFFMARNEKIPSEAEMKAAIALRGIGQRLKVQQVRRSIRSDAARVRREIDRELRDYDGGA